MFRAALLFLMLPLAFATGQDTIGQDEAVDRLPEFAHARFGSTRFRFGLSAAYLRYARDGQLLTALDYDDFKDSTSLVWDVGKAIAGMTLGAQ